MYDLSVNMWKSCSMFSITKYNDLGQASDDRASRLHSWQYHVPQKSTRINGSEAWYDLLHGPPAEYVEWSPWSVVEGYRTLGQKGNKGLGDSLVYGVLDRVSKLWAGHGRPIHTNMFAFCVVSGTNAPAKHRIHLASFNLIGSNCTSFQTHCSNALQPKWPKSQHGKRRGRDI